MWTCLSCNSHALLMLMCGFSWSECMSARVLLWYMHTQHVIKSRLPKISCTRSRTWVPLVHLPHDVPYDTYCLQESVCQSQSGLKISDGGIILYLLQAKIRCQNEWNNLSLHDLQAFITTLLRVIISRGACSTWAVLLQHII